MMDDFGKRLILIRCCSGITIDVTYPGLGFEPATKEVQLSARMLGLDNMRTCSFIHVAVNFILCADVPIEAAPGNIPRYPVLPGGGSLLEIGFYPFLDFIGSAFNLDLETDRIKDTPFTDDRLQFDFHNGVAIAN
jgi:hypothetical protein